MAIDHKRPLPVADERLDHLTALYSADAYTFAESNIGTQLMILQIALLGEQVEHLQTIAMGIQDAHDIYNGRFR